MDCFLREVMRLKPSVVYPIVRQAKSDIQIKDLFIKKGSYTLLASFLANINSNHYEKPLEFNPKRWLQQQPIRIDNGFVISLFMLGQKLHRTTYGIDRSKDYSYYQKIQHLQQSQSIHNQLVIKRNYLEKLK